MGLFLWAGGHWVAPMILRSLLPIGKDLFGESSVLCSNQKISEDPAQRNADRCTFDVVSGRTPTPFGCHDDLPGTRVIEQLSSPMAGEGYELSMKFIVMDSSLGHESIVAQ